MYISCTDSIAWRLHIWVLLNCRTFKSFPKSYFLMLRPTQITGPPNPKTSPSFKFQRRDVGTYYILGGWVVRPASDTGHCFLEFSKGQLKNIDLKKEQQIDHSLCCNYLSQWWVEFDFVFDLRLFTTPFLDKVLL